MLTLTLKNIPEDLHAMLKDGFKVSAQRSTSPKPGEDFDHSSRLAIVDKQGVIRGYFDGLRSSSLSKDEANAMFEMDLRELRAKVERLLEE